MDTMDSTALAGMTLAEKEQWLETVTGRVQAAAGERTKAIKAAEDTRVRALRTEIRDVSEFYQGEIRVCGLRAEREIERLRKLAFPATAVLEKSIVSKLPAEMLSYVFQLCVAELDMPPWNLVKVCKEWMDLAFASPRLWSYIRIALRMPGYRRGPTAWVVDGVRWYSKGREQFCCEQEELDAAIRRSGAVPLHVTVTSLSNLTQQMVKTVLCAGLSERLESLDMTDIHAVDWQTTWHPLEIGSFLRLRRLALPRFVEPVGSRILQSVSESSERIEDMSLWSAFPASPTQYLFWERLKSLSIKHRGSTDANASGFALNLITPYLKGLENFNSPPTHWPNEDTPKTKWKRVGTIDLKCNPIHLDRVSFPNLHTLKLLDTRSEAGQYTGKGGALQISWTANITSLEVTTSNPFWLSGLIFPNVTQLSLKSYQLAGPPIQYDPISQGEPFPNVRRLTIESSWAEEVVLPILDLVPSLKHLQISPTYGGNAKNFAVVILKRLSTRDEEDEDEPSLLCPKLQELEIGSNWHLVQTLKKTAVPILKRLVTTRKQLGRPLKVCKVFWSKGRGVESYA